LRRGNRCDKKGQRAKWYLNNILTLEGRGFTRDEQEKRRERNVPANMGNITLNIVCPGIKQCKSVLRRLQSFAY